MAKIVNDDGRTCTKCGEFKLWECFGNHSSGTNGKAPRCNSCEAERSRLRFKDKQCSLGKTQREDYHVTDLGRICTKCGKDLPWSMFNKGNSARGHSAVCCHCRAKYREEHSKSIAEGKKKCYELKREEYSQKQREYRKQNLEKYKEYSKDYYIQNKDRLCEKQRLYYIENKSRCRKTRAEYVKHRLLYDPSFKLQYTLRDRLRTALKSASNKKVYSTNDLLGCSPKECIDHLNNNEFGYNVKDHGYSTLHIDHIIPVNFFDLSDPLHQLICFNYRNLQLLPCKENIQKSDSISVSSISLFNRIRETILEDHPELEARYAE